MPQPTVNAKIAQRIELAPGNIVLQVAPVGWECPAFRPGQYSVLGLPGSAPRSPLCDPDDPPVPPDKMILRAYSVASSAKSRDHVEFYISVVRSGALTPRLYALGLGDDVYLSPRFVGLMTLESVPRDANVVLIATGTGLAPYMSMVRTLVMSGGFDRRYAVIHGARHSWDLGYRSELETLANVSDRFTYLPVINEPAKEHVPWHGPVGFVEDAWKAERFTRAWGGRPTKDDTHVFLCGNPLMIESALRFLGEDGFAEGKNGAGQIHMEKYW
jgi:ferredoxin--NADP+ reductase